MEIRLTVDATGEAETDIRLRGGARTTIGDVRQALVEGGLWPADARLAVGGRSLDDGDRAGERLLEGTVLRARPEPQRPAPVGAVRVVAGPRCGSTHPLAAGTTVIGRDASCGLRVDDDQVSAQHARLDVDGSGVVVTDLGSTNGTGLDGVHVTAPTAWSGGRLRVGATTLLLVPTAPVPPLLASAGRVPIAVPPRLRDPDADVEVRFPDEPGPRRRTRFPLAAAFAPVLVGLVVAAVLRSPTFLLFALLSPVVVLASAASDRAHSGRDHREERRTFLAATERATQTLQASVAAEEVRRHEADPDCAHVLDTAGRRGPRLWERRPSDADVLRVRVGTADLPSRVRVVGAVGGTCPAVPVTVDLPRTGALGLVGDRDSVLAVARAVVGSAAVLHAPSVLRLVVLCPGRRVDWAWARWLPHALGGAGTASLATDTADAREHLGRLTSRLATERRDEPRVLVVVDGRELRDDPDLAAILERGPAVGLHVLCLGDGLEDLPSACPALFHRAGGSASWTLRRDGEPAVPDVDPDGADAGWADAVARALAPLVLTGGGRVGESLPARVAWDDVTGLRLAGGEPDVLAVLARWERGGGPVATVGVAATGPLTVDLREDGPHCLVAGTTGSGKSALLQTLVAGLALSSPPEALQLVLVDYKGGAAFGPCARLPHTAGVVTDLDPSLTRRALASLAAELRRREHTLLAAGAADIAAYDELRRAGARHDLAPLARLVVVVDEFAGLAEELPEFVRGLVAVAQRGRSLGVHLVLATQRPEGAVSQDIRANTALRICLAVARESDSRDVLDAPDAARIDGSTPGRGFLRRAAGPLLPFQVAAVGLPPAERDVLPAPVTVTPLTSLGLESSAPEPAWTTLGSRPALGPTALDMLVDACAAAAQGLAQVPPPPPWLPPLPDRVGLDDLPALDPLGRIIPFALQDVPSRQTRRALGLDLRENLAVIGGPRSGRSSTLLTIAAAAARLCSPSHLHVVGVDASGTGLRGLDALPHCGVSVTLDETERLRRLVAALVSRIRQRRARSGRGAGTGTGTGGDAEAEPHLLLLVDQWDALVAACADAEGSRLVDDLLQVLRDGPAVGVTAVVSADRSALVGRVGGLLPRRLLLRLPDLSDYAAAGLAPRDVPGHLGPGRGLCGDGLLTQVALVDPDDPADVAAAVARLGASLAAGPGDTTPVERRPLRIDPLPTQVTLDEAEALTTRPSPAGALTVGVGGDELAPARLDLDEVSPVLLVSGPPRSGRSTALLTLLAGLREQDARPRAAPETVVVVAPRTSPLRRPDRLPAGATVVTDTTDAPALQRLLGPAAVLVVDDVELVLETALGPVLEAAVASARDTGAVVLAAGTTSALLQCYRGWVTDARRTRTGLLLAPGSAADGELLGCRLPRPSGGPGSTPGRGVLVVRGEVETVQVALPPSPHPPTARHVAATGGSPMSTAA